MTRLIHWIRKTWSAATATPSARTYSLYLILGVIGWALIVLYYPFDWELPQYANY